MKLSEAAAGSPPYFQRTLRPDDTGEVRIHLGAGDDRVIARGASSPITVRVIGDAGCEAVDVTGGVQVRVSDAEFLEGEAYMQHALSILKAEASAKKNSSARLLAVKGGAA